MAAPRIDMDFESIQLGRTRYLRMLATLTPIAHTHLKAMEGHEVRSAMIGLDATSSGMMQLFGHYLDSGHTPPDQQETLLLITLLLAINPYLSARGLFAENLRWGTALFDHCTRHNWHYQPALLAQISKAHIECEQPDQQIAFAEPLLATALDSHMQASLHLHLTTSYFRKQAYDRALHHALSAYSVLANEAEPEDIGCAQAAMDAFSALVALRQPQEAENAARLALRHAIQAGDPFQTAAALLIQAQAHTLMKRYDEAFPLYETALQFFTEMNHLPHVARAKFTFAVYHHLTGNDEEARRLTWQSRDLFQHFGMTTDQYEADALLRLLGT